jgi:hypothetical protein
METGHKRYRKWRPATWMVEGQVAGGFTFVRTGAFFHCWESYKSGAIQLRDLRTWLAVAEMLERRHASGARRRPRFSAEELVRITGVPDVRRVRGSLRRLVKAGVIEWSGEQSSAEVSSVKSRLDTQSSAGPTESAPFAKPRIDGQRHCGRVWARIPMLVLPFE